MSFKTYEQQQGAIAAAAEENAKKDCIAQVYAKFPLIVQCEAAAKMILEIIARFAGHDVVPSLDLFLSALDENPDAMSMLATRSQKVTHRQLMEQIIDLLRAKGKGHDEFSLRNEQRKLTMMSVSDLRARLATLQANAKMAAAPLSEHYKALEDSRINYGSPQMPKEVYQDGKLISLDAATIRNMHPFEIKRLIRIYGSDQVNARLRGE